MRYETLVDLVSYMGGPSCAPLLPKRLSNSALFLSLACAEMDMIPNDPSNIENGSSPSSGGQTPAPISNTRPGLSVNRSSIAVACVACRSRHLKCDGMSFCGAVACLLITADVQQAECLVQDAARKGSLAAMSSLAEAGKGHEDTRLCSDTMMVSRSALFTCLSKSYHTASMLVFKS
jgi:hypothetical protein